MRLPIRRSRSRDRNGGGDDAKELALRHVRSVTVPRRIPTWTQFRQLPHVLSHKEKRVIQIAFGAIILSLLYLAFFYVDTHRIDTPAVGGEYTEALIGKPLLINPLYAQASDVDQDLTALVYSGLMKWDPEKGLVTDLADSLNLSEDGKVYTLHIRDDARFHNGETVRSRDVLFTVGAIQNPAYRSPLIASFRGVVANQIDDETIEFVLDEPFAPFLSSLTVGILPANLWAGIEAPNATLASLNTKPIGSGPYKFKEFEKNKLGEITRYTLERNDDFYDHPPLIELLNFKFYSDARSALRALDNRNVQGIGFIPPDLLPEIASNRAVDLVHASMPRQIALFFNAENEPIFKDLNVRKAFAHALIQEQILESVPGERVLASDSPLLEGSLGFLPDLPRIETDIAKSQELLDDAGYTRPEDAEFRIKRDADKNEVPFVFTLTTVNTPEFVAVANTIQEQLAHVGIQIDLDLVDQEFFYSSVIEPRKYDLLLTGILSGIDGDPFPFWHSSQAVNGKLNLAGYINRNTDELLEKARASVNEQDRIAAYEEFQKLIAADVPAIFLYQSAYTYAPAAKLKNVRIDRIINPSDRFANIASWYIKTKKRLN